MFEGVILVMEEERNPRIIQQELELKQSPGDEVEHDADLQSRKLEKRLTMRDLYSSFKTQDMVHLNGRQVKKRMKKKKKRSQNDFLSAEHRGAGSRSIQWP
jgi:hypothetical protein